MSVATVTEVHDAKPVPRGREAAVAVAANVAEATQASLHLPQNHRGGAEGRGQKLRPDQCGHVIVSDAGSPEVEGPLAQSLGQLSHQSLQAWTAGLPGRMQNMNRTGQTESFPSLISLMVSVDAKHRVYLLLDRQLRSCGKVEVDVLDSLGSLWT